jgi:hypothetical protein
VVLNGGALASILFPDMKIDEQIEDMKSLSKELLREIPISDLTGP